MYMNRGNYLRFGSFVLSDLGVVEHAEYENLSIDVLTLERALLPPEYFATKRNFKSISVQFRYIHNTIKIREIEKKLDSIIGQLHNIGLEWLVINDLRCNAVLAKAKRNVVGNTGVIDLEFINVNGLFYGEHKIESVSTSLTIDTLIPTDHFIIYAKPTVANASVTHVNSGKKITLVDAPLKEIELNNYRKTAMTGGVHVGITLDSEFFKLDNGVNTFSFTGMTAKIGYREVVAL